MQGKQLLSVVTALMGIVMIAPGWAADVKSDAKPEAKVEVKADAKPDGKTTVEPTLIGSAKVSIAANNMKLSDAIDLLAKQSKEKFVVESSVAGQITLNLADVELEQALSAISKTSSKMQWRKVYIAAGSELIDQPDKFAATVRLISGLSFPNMVMAGSSTGKTVAHFDDQKGVGAAEETAAKTLGMVKVYLITNDTAIAAKTASSEKKKGVENFIKSQKDQMDAFMKMSPEEREQAIMESVNMMDQVGPEYMGAAMDAISNNPEALKRITSRQNEMLLNMSQETRRAMIRMGMQNQQNISPEVIKIMQEDVAAVMEEMKAQQGAP